MIFLNYILLLAFQIGFITLPLNLLQAELVGKGVFVIVSLAYLSFVVYGIVLATKFICKRLISNRIRFLLLAIIVISIYALSDALNVWLILFSILLAFILMPAGAAIGLEGIRKSIRRKILMGLFAAIAVIMFGWGLAAEWPDGLNAFSGEKREYAEFALQVVNSRCVGQGFNRLSAISSEGRHYWRVASVDPITTPNSRDLYRVKVHFYSWMGLPTYAIYIPPLDDRALEALCDRRID